VHAVADTHVDAVVSLCRMGSGQVPAGVEHVEVPLIDRSGANAHLRHLVLDTAAGVAALRAEGKRVLLHCAAGQSRTPAVAAAYLHLRFGYSGEEALRRVGQVLDHHPSNTELVSLVRSLPSRAPSP
jgi:protein-tyrosine phosphatase